MEGSLWPRTISVCSFRGISLEHLANEVALSASYGSLARFTGIKRIKQVGDHTIVGAGGDISDMQYLFDKLLESVLCVLSACWVYFSVIGMTDLVGPYSIKEEYQNDGHALRAPHIYSYLARVLYNRRCKFNFLWNSILVAGYDDEKKPYTLPFPITISLLTNHAQLPCLRRPPWNSIFLPSPRFRLWCSPRHPHPP